MTGWKEVRLVVVKVRDVVRSTLLGQTEDRKGHMVDTRRPHSDAYVRAAIPAHHKARAARRIEE